MTRALNPSVEARRLRPPAARSRMVVRAGSSLVAAGAGTTGQGRTLRLAWRALLVAGLLSGCQDPAPGGDPAEGSDPETVSILDLDTIRVIEDDLIWRISWIRLGDDGRMFAVTGTTEILVFGPDGTLDGRIGSRGQGPGEFATIPRGMAVMGDSVYVLDPLLRRVSLFVAGEFRESRSFREMPGIAERLWVRQDGHLLLSAMVTPTPDPAPPGSHRFLQRPIRLFDVGRLGSEGWTEIFEFPGPEAQFMYLEGGVGQSLPPFWTSTVYGLIETGLVGAERRSGRVWKWRWDGTEVPIRDAPEPTYVSDWELALFETRITERQARLAELGENPEWSVQRVAAALDRWEGQIPRPVYSNLLTDGQYIALEKYDMRDEVPKEWLVLDMDGNAVGTWTVPGSVRLHALRWPVIAAVSTDEWDVESILLLRVRQ